MVRRYPAEKKELLMSVTNVPRREISRPAAVRLFGTCIHPPARPPAREILEPEINSGHISRPANASESSYPGRVAITERDTWNFSPENALSVFGGVFVMARRGIAQRLPLRRRF